MNFIHEPAGIVESLPRTDAQLCPLMNEVHSERTRTCSPDSRYPLSRALGSTARRHGAGGGGGDLRLRGLRFLTAGGFQDPNSQSTHAQTLLDQQLGGATTDIVLLLRSDTLKATDPAFAGAASADATVQARPEVASVTSYYSTHSPSFLSRDGHETFVAVQLTARDETTKETEYNTLLPLLTSPTLQVSVGGKVAVNVAINKQISADLERAEILTFPIVSILLVIVFGGLVAASLPLLIGGSAILGAFAILRLLTGLTDISVFAINVVTVVGLGLAIDYSLFIVTRFREELAPDERDVRGALQRTLATAGRTVLFSGLTVSLCS